EVAWPEKPSQLVVIAGA
nr:periplasmic protein 5 {N-terminal} [Rhodobacter sphaeroides, forma sp. denitrificans, Peptide Partial, 17 aa] [Cereibacter sphaeroides]